MKRKFSELQEEEQRMVRNLLIIQFIVSGTLPNYLVNNLHQQITAENYKIFNIMDVTIDHNVFVTVINSWQNQACQAILAK